MKKFLLSFLLAFFMPVAAPAQERNFDQVSQKELCEAIQEVLRLRESRFQTVLGERTRDDIHRSTYRLPGMMPHCSVRRISDWVSYSCIVETPFNWRTASDSQVKTYMEKVHGRFSACLKPPKISRGTSLGPFITYDYPSYREADNIRSAVVIGTAGGNLIVVHFNTLPK
jgi:hypothetical protein